MGFTPKATRRSTTFERYTHARRQAARAPAARAPARADVQAGRLRRSLVELRAVRRRVRLPHVPDRAGAHPRDRRVQRVHRARARRRGCSASTARYEAPYTPTLLRDAPARADRLPGAAADGRGLDAAERERRRHGPARRRAWRCGPGSRTCCSSRGRTPSPGLQLVRTPWRVAVIGRLATIVESDLVDDLARARPAEPTGRGSGPGASRGRGGPTARAPPASTPSRRTSTSPRGWAGSTCSSTRAGTRPGSRSSWPTRAPGDVRVLLWARWDALALRAQRDALLSQLARAGASRA